MLLVELGLLSLLARSAAGIEHRPAALANHAASTSTLKPVIVMQSPSDQASSSNHGFSRFFMYQFGRIVGTAKFIASAQESSPSRPAGSSTCDGGYCLAGDACVRVDGVQGCCPIGQSCTTESPSCALHGYAPCSGDNYCCPAGDTCARDANDDPTCIAGDHRLHRRQLSTPPPTPTPQPQPTPQPTPTPTPEPTPGLTPTPTPEPTASGTGPGDTLTPAPTPTASGVGDNSTATFTGTDTATGNMTFSPNAVNGTDGGSDNSTMPPSTLPPPPTPLPTASDAATSTFSLVPPAETEAPKAATNVTVMAQDPRIEYSPQWVTTTTCTNDTKSANEAGANMLFSFTGSAIFLNLNMGLTGLVFQAALDGQIDTVDAFRSNGDQCGTGWARYGLDDSRSHTVNVTILGKSPNAPPDGSGSSQAAFDFMNFTVLAAPNSTASSSTTNAIPSGKFAWTVGAVSAFAVLMGSTLL